MCESDWDSHRLGARIEAAHEVGEGARLEVRRSRALEEEQAVLRQGRVQFCELSLRKRRSQAETAHDGAKGKPLVGRADRFDGEPSGGDGGGCEGEESLTRCRHMHTGDRLDYCAA